MIYAYIRVSTDKQTVENQKFEVQNFANDRRLIIDKWISETVSGTKAAGQKLGRQKGEKITHYKLDKKAELISRMLAEGSSKAAICRKLKCHLVTLNNHLERVKYK